MDAGGGRDLRQTLARVCDEVIARAPELAGPRVARASLLFQVGEPVAAAAELRLAMLATADLADGRELLGRMLTELGELETGIGHLRVAHALEPAMHHTVISIARAEALRGRPGAAEALLRGPEAVGLTPNLRFSTRARLLMWNRDREGATDLAAEIAPLDFELKPQIQGTIQLVLHPSQSEATLAALARFTHGLPTAAPRLRAYFHQITAEFHALADERGPVIGALDEAFALGLVDIAWLDHCPLFRGFAREPAFVRVREKVRERASQALAVLNGR